jgi:hypothetical protein
VQDRIVVPLAPADLERERPNLERGSLVAAGVKGVAIGAFRELELLFPSGASVVLTARAVLDAGAGTVFAFEARDRALLAPHLAAADAEPEAPADAGTLQDRLRGLSVVEQLRVAREGSIEERVVLERLYGKTVWEALLRNTRVTVPEVARLAKLGTLPRPLLELIVGSPAWLQVPQIRRALLANPRLTPEMVPRVLALVPKEELKQLQHAAAYPAAVREAAKRLLRGP